MFDDLIRELNRMKSMEISVPIEADELGYLDKQCPAENCLFQFKIMEEDWQNLCSDEAIWCPLCGHSAPSQSWWTEAQVEYVRKVALSQIKAKINEAMRRDARRFNQRQPRNGFIRISLEVKGNRSAYAFIPQLAGEALELRIQCESCSARFAVLGSGFFCPACGRNSAPRTFNDGLRKVRAKLDALDAIREAVANTTGRDEAELIARSIVETALSDCVVAFQRLCEQLYSGIPGAPATRSNVFQRIDDADALWGEVIGLRYSNWLDHDQMDRLRLLFQRRHLLAHTEGIVDERYIARSSDSAYKIGQRIAVKPADAKELADLVETLGHSLREALTERGHSA